MPEIDKLLKMAKDIGASDLHISVGAPPILRLHGVLRRTKHPPLDAKQTKSLIAIKPKPPFKPVFQVAVSRKGSNIRILNESSRGSSVFLVETGETLSLPETRILCFA